MIYLQLFLSFLQVGLFSVGGGYAAIPLIQQQVVVNHSWLSMSEFTHLITIAEMTPGSIAVNSATFVGINIAGFSGALVATFGCILPSCILVSLLAWLYYKYKGLTAMESVLSCLRPTVVALIAGAGLSMLGVTLFGENNILLSGQHVSDLFINIMQSIDWISAGIFLIAFIVLRRWKPSPILVMSMCGVVFMLLGIVIK